MAPVEVVPKRTRLSIDGHVAWFCAAGGAFIVGCFLGMWIVRHQAPPPLVCAPALEDGRKLLAYHLSVHGMERCLYEAPHPLANGLTNRKKG